VDTIARIGGDEFAILLDEICDPSEAIGVADRLLQDISQPFTLQGQQIYTSASIGIALSATGYAHEAEVLRDADSAMYRAKAQGKACHAMFDGERHTRAVRQHQLEAELRQALERREFRLYYQPIFCLANTSLVGFEALARWEHPELGRISPAEFIPLAELSGLIVTLGDWVLREACAQIRRWEDEGYGALRMSVNCSVRQFEQPGFDEVIARILQQTGVAPEQLDLEITEGVIMRDVGTSLATLRRLRDLGVQISIDDFGTGYSGLGYLRHLPVTSLKIDQSFVRDLLGDQRSAAIVNSIVTLAHSLDLNVVAEGVETEAQLHCLRDLSCDEFQGFLMSPPVPADQLTSILGQNHSRRLVPRTLERLSSSGRR
jgi:EAL domain-containing protein (putative c-di-GMP-specific phosphodiesterase class I)